MDVVYRQDARATLRFGAASIALTARGHDGVAFFELGAVALDALAEYVHQHTLGS